MPHPLVVALLVNWGVNIVLIEFLVLRKLKNIIKGDEARDGKYSAFRRTDVKWMTRKWLYPTCHFALFKFVATFAIIFSTALLIKILAIGKKPGEPLRGIRYKIGYWIMRFTGRVTMFGAAGCVWISSYRPKVDYRKYLGPDWEPDYDTKRTSTIVSNHSTFLDSMLHAMTQLPCHIAKGDVKDYPGVGTFADVA